MVGSTVTAKDEDEDESGQRERRFSQGEPIHDYSDSVFRGRGLLTPWEFNFLESTIAAVPALLFAAPFQFLAGLPAFVWVKG
jgi:hypothetical protein